MHANSGENKSRKTENGILQEVSGNRGRIRRRESGERRKGPNFFEIRFFRVFASLRWKRGNLKFEIQKCLSHIFDPIFLTRSLSFLTGETEALRQKDGVKKMVNREGPIFFLLFSPLLRSHLFYPSFL